MHLLEHRHPDECFHRDTGLAVVRVEEREKGSSSMSARTLCRNGPAQDSLRADVRSGGI
jgi:hypothetical protein